MAMKKLLRDLDKHLFIKKQVILDNSQVRRHKLVLRQRNLLYDSLCSRRMIWKLNIYLNHAILY